MLHCRWVISHVLGHLLCSKTAIPVRHRWILSLLFQTICLLSSRCLHCCPQKNDFSPSVVSGQWRLEEELALLRCAICLWRGCFVPPMYKSVQNKRHYSVSASACWSVWASQIFPRHKEWQCFPLCPLWIFRGFDKGPVWVATGFKRSPDEPNII